MKHMGPIFEDSLLSQLFHSIDLGGGTEAAPIGPSHPSSESTAVLLDLLKQDMAQWHLYWNYQGYHK